LKRIKLLHREVAAAIAILLVFGATAAHGQSPIITGYVQDSSGNPLQYATVNLVNDKATVLQFAFTNEKGAFSFTLGAGETSLPRWLEATYVGFQRRRQALSPLQSTYYLKLAADTGMLKEVVVHRKPPIEQMGDTTRYNVDEFAQKEDRTIADVLRRMPGIEVDDDGAISYNGIRVSNLYIHGDDLMSGSYGMATRVIRKEMIVSVDLIRNFQPIKVLKNKMPSDNTAINLVLRDEKSLKLSVNGMAGAGWPRLYDGSATGILLNSRFKAIDKVSFNNCGVDYSDDFKQLGNSNFISDVSNAAPKVNLSLATVGSPDIPLPNYYFNNSGIVNLNNLYKTKNNVQFKVNVQGSIDRSTLNYLSRTDNYLLHDTISYSESQSLVNRPTQLKTAFNILVNKDRCFLTNNMKFELSNSDNNSSMNFNGYAFEQGVNNKVNSFSNDLNLIPSLSAKGIGELRWLVSYNGNRQSLGIGRGYDFQVPPQQGFYDSVVQRVQVPALFSNLQLGYKVAGNTVAQAYTVGIMAESQDLVSQLQLNKGGAGAHYTGDVGNNLHWNRYNVSFTPEYDLKYGKLRSGVKLPVALQSIHYYQQEYSLDSKKNRFLFNPVATVKYEFTPEQSLNANYSFNNSFSNITGVFRGGILTNYKAFSANDADIQEKSTHSVSASYNYQKAVKMMFFNTGIIYSTTRADAVSSNEYLNNIQKIVFLPYNNSLRHLSLNAGFSKYLFKLKLTGSLTARWSRSRYMEILNGQMQPFYSDNLLFGAKLIKKFLPAVSLTYEPRGSWSTSWVVAADSLADKLTHHAFRLDQRLILGIAPMNRTNVEVSARHSFSNKTNSNGVQYFFMDAKATYTPTNKKMDLSLSVTNLFNVASYTLYSLSPYQAMVSQYHIRGRMAILRLNYYF
jgi:hypothetical protein